MNLEQQHLFGLMKEVHQICEDNGIDYIICGGTLLGACRNGGFLPWDDDADIMMTRPNYEKFKEACKTCLPPNRAFGTPETDESFPFTVSRYISTDTTAFHNSQSLHDDIAGEVIDILRLDPIADGEEAFREYRRLLALLHDTIKYSSVASTRYDASVEEYDKYQEMLKEHGKLYTVEQIEARMAETFDPEGENYVLHWQGCPALFKREWMDNPAKMEFEGFTFNAPPGANEFLMSWYGEEWAELPYPIIPAKHNAASSLDFPYTEALEYYKPLLDRDDLRQRLGMRARSIIATGPLSNEVNDQMRLISARFARYELERKLAGKEEALEQALAEKDYGTICSLLKDYLAVQANKHLIGRHSYNEVYALYHPILIDVPDLVFAAAMFAYLCTGRVFRATTLLNLREEKGLPLTKEMLETREAIDGLHKTATAIQQGRFEEGVSRASQLMDQYPQVPLFNKLWVSALQWRYRHDATPESLEAYGAAAKQTAASFPEDGYFLWCEADYLDAAGAESAESIRRRYLFAAERTRNGFALSGIQKAIGYAPGWMRETEWGQAYGIPQWDEELPQGCIPEESQSAPAGDAAQTLLLEKLDKLAGYCKQNKVDYLLSPALSCALFAHRTLPATPWEFGICCKQADMEKLAQLLKDKPCDNLKPQLVRDEETGELTSVLLLIPNTTYVKLNRASLPENTNLYLSISLPPDYWKAEEVVLRYPDVTMPAQEDESLFGRIKAHLERNRRNKASRFVGFATPKDLYDLLKENKVKHTRGPIMGGLELVSATASGMDFLAQEDYLESYFALRQQLAEASMPGASQAKQDFQKNFAVLKRAVRLKGIALKLLPQKERIVALYKEGKFTELEETLGDYLLFAQRRPKGVNFKFDADIYKIARKVLSRNS